MNFERAALMYANPELARQRRQEILKRFAFGEKIKDIATSLELSYSRCLRLLDRAASETGLPFWEAVGSINPENSRFRFYKSEKLRQREFEERNRSETRQMADEEWWSRYQTQHDRH